MASRSACRHSRLVCFIFKLIKQTRQSLSLPIVVGDRRITAKRSPYCTHRRVCEDKLHAYQKRAECREDAARKRALTLAATVAVRPAAAPQPFCCKRRARAPLSRIVAATKRDPEWANKQRRCRRRLPRSAAPRAVGGNDDESTRREPRADRRALARPPN